MLNDLRRKAREYRLLFFKESRLIANGDQIIARRFSRARQRKTPFLRLVRHKLGHHTGIEHLHIRIFMEKADNACIDADHIRRHTHAFVRVRQKRIAEIICNRNIRSNRGRCFFS